ncbi:MAG: anion permease [Phycisphaerae bacterium]|nr:anion permease [Phycisphaerae bacterium]
MAWNIGANDVANAMGTSVGSGALTFKRAIILAAIFEFAGAYFVGGHVAQTIRKGIVPLEYFETAAQTTPADPTTPAITTAPAGDGSTKPVKQISEGEMRFGIGMLSALLAAALWLNVATFFGQPVSTTHAIVGAVVGFAISAVGFHAPNWWVLGKISASWVVSPLAGGFIAFVMYRAIQRFVLRSETPVKAAKHVVPVGMGAVVAVLCLSILYKVLKIDRVTEGVTPTFSGLQAIALSCAVGTAVAIVAWTAIHRVTRKSTHKPDEAYQVVERWFARVQPMTACYLAFAHGANDVANAIGPLAGAFRVFTGGGIGKNAPVPEWLLAIGGVGIVVGLATYGYKVVESIGRKITEITPTRGFAAEFATASTVLVCSRMGLPISTTLVLVGAVMGVGMARGFAAIDLNVIKRIFASWIITIPISAVFAGVFYRILCAIMI